MNLIYKNTQTNWIKSNQTPENIWQCWTPEAAQVEQKSFLLAYNILRLWFKEMWSCIMGTS